jgi:hypothetical protein
MPGRRSSLTGYIRPELFVAGALFPSLLWMLRKKGSRRVSAAPESRHWLLGSACWPGLVCHLSWTRGSAQDEIFAKQRGGGGMQFF